RCQCCLPLIFVYWTSPHRSHHPLPTRRSSDLEGTGDARYHPCAVPHPRTSFRCRSSAVRCSSIRRVLAQHCALQCPQPLHQFRQDRKSTRLNSSHVKNSYAVFCLKKKNHISHI